MKAETIDDFSHWGQKTPRGGHVLCKEDIRLLQSECTGTISVAQLDKDESLISRN